jgi:hypothetical protein
MLDLVRPSLGGARLGRLSEILQLHPQGSYRRANPGFFMQATDACPRSALSFQPCPSLPAHLLSNPSQARRGKTANILEVRSLSSPVQIWRNEERIFGSIRNSSTYFPSCNVPGLLPIFDHDSSTISILFMKRSHQLYFLGSKGVCSDLIV